MIQVTQFNGETKGFFEAKENNKKAGIMTYSWAGTEQFIIDHTEVEPDFNGKGIGKEMVLAADFARKNGLKIIPLCPFANAMFQRNTDLQDVLS